MSESVKETKGGRVTFKICHRSYSFNEGRKTREILNLVKHNKIKLLSVQKGSRKHEEVTIIKYELI
jgi:hypothetical protein